MKTLNDLIEIQKTKRIGNFLKIGSKLKTELDDRINFLNYNASNCEKLYYIKHNLHNQVKCPICNNKTKIGYNHGKYFIKPCSFSCNLKIINPETGLTKGQEIKQKQIKTMSQINPDTGLTYSKEASIKGTDTMSQINPETGLSIRQTATIKTKTKMSEIDPKSGLSIRQSSAIKTKTKLSEIDPETGLTGYQEIKQKQIKTMSQINPDTGLSYSKEASIKGTDTMSEIDPETGLSIRQTATIKTKTKMSEIDPKTGLNRYQRTGLINKEHMAQINPETGLTKGQEIKQKQIKTMSQINPDTGLTYSKEAQLKSAQTFKLRVFKKIKHELSNTYTLLTDELDYIKSNTIKYSCKKCNSIRESYWPYIRCLNCYPYNKSIGEQEVLEYCKTLTQNTISNSRHIIEPLELDIYLPNHNLAIEYNGLYWHSSNTVESENKDYHLNKTQLCQERGIQLFHIFENEWLDPTKQQIWKSIIKNKLGQSNRIYARKTEVAQVTSSERKEFLIGNHIQGDCVSSVNLGLILDGELISLMTFSKSRFSKKYDWELIRFCNKVGYSVVGGAGKLLKAFRRGNEGSIISYADKRRSNGNLYKKLGFEFSHESKPNYWYYKDSKILESRVKYQKHKLKTQLKNFDSGMTETENMYMNGYRKIYDCGNQVWIL